MLYNQKNEIVKMIFAFLIILLVFIVGIRAEVSDIVPEQNVDVGNTENLESNLDNNNGIGNDWKLNPDGDGNNGAGNDDKDKSVADPSTDICSGVNCESSSRVCADGYILTCDNSCDSLTGGCSSCLLDCSGHDVVEENTTLVINNSEALGNDDVEENSTAVTNDSIVFENETNKNESEKTDEKIGNAELKLSLISPSKIIRGEVFEVKAVILNSGKVAVRDVSVDWDIPNNFEIISESIGEECNILVVDSSCTLVVNVKTSFFGDVGKNQIGAEVFYGGLEND